jgi:hypothetical protein
MKVKQGVCGVKPRRIVHIVLICYTPPSTT